MGWGHGEPLACLGVHDGQEQVRVGCKRQNNVTSATSEANFNDFFRQPLSKLLSEQAASAGDSKPEPCPSFIPSTLIRILIYLSIL